MLRSFQKKKLCAQLAQTSWGRPIYVLTSGTIIGRLAGRPKIDVNIRTSKQLRPGCKYKVDSILIMTS